MTRHGGKIPDVTADAVAEQLSRASTAKAVKRLTAAREYLDGLSPAEIEEKYGYPEQTVYEWLDRIEAEGLEAALEDESPPGRPPRLSDAEWEQFAETVTRPPTAVGFDADEWTAALAREYLRDAIDVEFSRRHAGRLLHAAETADDRSRERSRRSDDGESGA